MLTEDVTRNLRDKTLQRVPYIDPVEGETYEAFTCPSLPAIKRVLIFPPSA